MWTGSITMNALSKDTFVVVFRDSSSTLPPGTLFSILVIFWTKPALMVSNTLCSVTWSLIMRQYSIIHWSYMDSTCQTPSPCITWLQWLWNVKSALINCTAVSLTIARGQGIWKSGCGKCGSCWVCTTSV